jgi:hypothetical protein
MATGGLYGSSGTGALIAQPGSESSGLYGNSTSFGGTYFEWFIFQTSETQPATPTGGSWNFTTNTNTPPVGWSSTPPANPLNTVWVSIALVNSRNTAPLVWSVPGKFAFASGLPILSNSGAPSPGDGQSDQLYIQLDTTPQTIWFKESGTWTRLTGSTLYADLTSNQTIAGTKTFSSQIQGSISGNAANVTGTVAITNGGTGSTTAGSARAALGAAASGANSDITSLSGLTTALSIAQGGTAATTAPDARTSLGLGSAAVLTAGAANGVATLDAGGTIPLSQIPASIQGGVSYQGAWNATTNTPTLTSSVGTKGYYYVVSVAGSTNLNGITSWNIGDWAIYNGTAWEKIDNTDAVTSVNGYTGTVVLTNTDISGFGTMSTQNANAVAITGGSINGTTIGATTPSTVTGTTVTATTLVVNDNSTLGSSNSDTVNFNARVNSDIDPSTNNAYDLGRNAHAWRNLYLTGTANIAALTASGSVTLNGGTANGVAYLNGSKVLTTGSALTFDGTTLTSGRFAANSSGYVVNPAAPLFGIYNGNGYVQAPSGGNIQLWSADTTAVLIADKSQTIFQVNGSEQMRLTSTGLGIGKSSPATKLDVKGAATSGTTVDVALFAGGVTSTTGSGAKIYLSDGGTARSTYISGFSLDGSTNAHALSFGVSAGFAAPAEGMRLTSTGLGIGTSSPAAPIDVVAGSGSTAVNIRGRSSDNVGSLYFTSNASAATEYGFLGGRPTDVRLYTIGSNPLLLGTNGAERMRIDSSGNLGLGVTPSAWGSINRVIDVGASSGQMSVYGRTDGTNDSGIVLNAYRDSANAWRYKATGYAQNFNFSVGAYYWNIAPSGTAGNAISFTQAMTLDASGNLGVGTTSPVFGSGSGIEIERSGANATLRLQRTTSSTSSAEFRADALSVYLETRESVPLIFGTNATERARIDTSGNLLIGATSAGAGNSRIYVLGDGTNPAFRALANTSTTSVYAGVFRHESTTGGAYIQFVTDSNIETGRIFDSAGTMQYASSSDARLKTNVQPLQGGLSSVLSMNPCTYDMRRGEATTISSAGLIAQEVYEIYPHAVGVGGDDENTNPWSVDYGKLTPLLIKAIQEQQAIIESLKARLDAANL